MILLRNSCGAGWVPGFGIREFLASVLHLLHLSSLGTRSAAVMLIE